MQGRTSLGSFPGYATTPNAHTVAGSANLAALASRSGLRDFWLGALIVLGLLVLGFVAVHVSGDVKVAADV